jgi:molecular chaperone GrpE
VNPDREPEGAGDGTPAAGVDEPGTAESRADAEAAAPDPLSALQAERDVLQDQLVRLAAEFDNHRKRTAREWREQKERAAAEVLMEMLELADNLERALAAPGEEHSLRRGVELILQQVQVRLKRFGVEAMDVGNQEFDPTRHEAVLMVENDDVPSHHVVDVVQRGYTLHGGVLRPARVTVAR